MKFSIITINYKSENLTINLLKNLLKIYHDTSMEIIVVDNGSDSEILEEFIKKTGNKIKIIKNKKNMGFAQAGNQGAQIAEGKFLIFLNNDTAVKDDFISPCLRALEGDKKIGAISPAIFKTSGKRQKMSYGNFPSLKEFLKIKLKKELESDQRESLTFVDWISGCVFIIKNDLFKKIGRWDSNFFLYYEDVDICQRLKNFSYKIAICNQCSVNHLENGSPMKIEERKKHYYQSQDYYFKKHHSKIKQIMVKNIRFFYLKYRLLKKSSL